MIRYLRGKEFLDVLHDVIAWLVPGRVGKVMAVSIKFTIILASMIVIAWMYVVNYPNFFWWL